METNGVYFWQRLSPWANRLVIGSALCMAFLGLLIGGLAAAAQANATATTVGSSLYSVPMHVVAMVALASLAVTLAVGLRRLGRTDLASVTLLGASIGPMTVVAVPVRESLVAASFQDAVVWWHALIAGVLFAVLAGWSWWADRCLSERLASSGSVPSNSANPLYPWLTFVVATALSLIVYTQMPAQANTPAMRAILGWAIVAAAIVVVTAFGPTWWIGIAMTLAAGAALGLLVAAYSRSGGWPGVAGWELNGMQSPIITSWASTVVLLAAGSAGLILRGIAYLFARHRRPSSARAGAAAGLAVV